MYKKSVFILVILPYLTILTLQIKNVISDNDYEFPLSAFTFSISQLASQSSTSLMSVSSSPYSQSSIKLNEHQHYQQDVVKICALLYDIYQRLCTNTKDENKTLYISRQSLQESLLPGLLCLKEVFQNHVISISSTGPNEYVLQLERIITIIEKMHHQGSMQDLTSSPMPK